MSIFSKAFKKIGKVIKKAVPILNVVAGFTPLGGVAKLASGGLKTISKLKSTGANVKRMAMGAVPLKSERATVTKLTQGGIKSKAAPKTTTKKTPAAKKPAAKKSKVMTAKQTALYKELWGRWTATGGKGAGENEDGLTWEAYAHLWADELGG